MKTLNKYIGIVALSGMLLGGTSCLDLQEDSLTESSSATFWQNANDALLALTACYDGLQDVNLYNSDQYNLGPLYMDCMTDNGGHFNWSGWMDGYDVAMGIQNPSSSVFDKYWKSCYEVIRRCNLLLSNIDRIPSMDETEKKRMKAEAIVLRALIYTNLTMTYQDVPYLTESLTIENAQVGKTSREEIVKQVMADLKSNVPNLPDQVDRGRLSQGAGYALLGRLALYNQKWGEAIAAYREVQKKGYKLYPDYQKLFTQEGEKAEEIIFAVRYEGPGMGEGTGITGQWNTPLEAMNGTIDLADDFYTTEGKKVTDKNYGEMQGGKLDISKPNLAHYENRDPRLYTTLFVPGMLWNGKGGGENIKDIYGGAAPSMSTIYVMKYFDPKDTSNSWDSGQDFYVVRYAEVLLSLAEALVENGNYDKSEVYALVNEVRQRTSVNMPKIEEVEGSNLSKEDLLEVIRHERRVELAFEGLRLFDLYRWKMLDKAVEHIENERTSLGLAYEPRKFNGEKDYVWPIPTSEVDTNKKLEQHELWK